MKKLLTSVLLIILLFTGSQTFAQTDKGKILLAGNTNLSFLSMKNKNATDYYDLETISAKSFELTPEFGVFIAKNFVLGLAVRYTSDETKTGNETYKSTSLYGIPMLQLYFGKDNIKPYVYAGAGFGNATDSETGYGTGFGETKKKQTLLEAGGGLAVFINQNVSLEIGGAYSVVTSRYTDIVNNDRKDTIKGFGFKIGLVLCL